MYITYNLDANLFIFLMRAISAVTVDGIVGALSPKPIVSLVLSIV